MLLRAPVLAAALLAVWVAVYPRTPDLAGAFYRTALFKQIGFAVWDEHWYAGHHLIGYSVLFPPLAAGLGLRVVGCLSVLASVIAAERLLGSGFGRAGRAGAALFAVAAVGDVWMGRIAFALGVPLALGAYLALSRRRTVVAVVLATLSAVASPVAGALLALAALTRALTSRPARASLVLVITPLLVIAALALLFPEGGFEPFPFRSFVATVAVVIAFLVALPARERALRVGGVLYLVCCAAALVVHTPVGSNVERYGVLLAGPLLLSALLWSGAPTSARALARLPRALGARGALALALWAVWCAWGPVRETAAVGGNPSTSASYYAPVKRFLAQRGPVRIEVPLTRSHWEAALLAGSASLARGWQKQLDERYDGVLLGHDLTPASYRRWLQREAVSYVALPDTKLDPSSSAEGGLIRAGLPYLREVFASAHWRIYAVADPTPLVSGPGSLTSLGHDSFALRVGAPGRLHVRVHFSRYLALTSGHGCVRAAPEGWTAVSARSAGEIVIQARFSLDRALGFASACR